MDVWKFIFDSKVTFFFDPHSKTSWVTFFGRVVPLSSVAYLFNIGQIGERAATTFVDLFISNFGLASDNEKHFRDRIRMVVNILQYSDSSFAFESDILNFLRDRFYISPYNLRELKRIRRMFTS